MRVVVVAEEEEEEAMVDQKTREAADPLLRLRVPDQGHTLHLRSANQPRMGYTPGEAAPGRWLLSLESRKLSVGIA